MRRISLLLVSLALALTACAEEAAPTTVPTSSSSVPPTTAATSTTEAMTTTSQGSTTTSGAETTTTSTLALDQLDLTLVEVASGFEQPVFLTAPPGDPRLFVVDQPGRIWVIDDADPAVFLDIRDRVAFGGERGLLGLAFHPDYARNGLFYVHYSGAASGETVIAEFSASADPDVADPASERLVYTTPQPATNHNGGMIAFGPDGYLWIALGDGGGANDRYGNGQRTDTPLGTLLRVEVGPGVTPPYAIPAGNPFADGVGGVAELWAYGLRNPWRFSFDGDTLYIGDVGQNQIEEVDAMPASAAGVNYGWPIMEGSTCFQTSGCEQTGLTLPIVDYTHADGCSITGGYVYRGSAIPELDGYYFYSDYCSGFLRSLRWDGTAVTDERDWTPVTGGAGNVTSFGIDAAGELYVVTANGKVSRLERR